MAVDVLTYNALAEINQGLRAKIAELDASITALEGGGGGGGTTLSDPQRAVAASQGWHGQLWCAIPKTAASGASWTGGVTVCDTSGYYRCGASCTWTVPSGVTCARFQIWGAGGASGIGCCCGYGIAGGTGAYASVIIPVTAGQSYTLCAGCAYCCFPGFNAQVNPGCQSYVQGAGLTNFCAMGGEGCLFKRGCSHGCQGWCIMEADFRSQVGCCLRWMGMCPINQPGYMDVCLSTHVDAYAWPRERNRMHFPMIRSSERKYYGSATNGSVYGYNGMYPQFFTGDSSGMRVCSTHPPVYGWLGCCDYLGSSKDGCTYSIGGCCHSAYNGFGQVPSRGGSYVMKCGGYTSTPCGDAGKFGMVCVSYL